jgi:hypothetical protein
MFLTRSEYDRGVNTFSKCQCRRPCQITARPHRHLKPLVAPSDVPSIGRSFPGPEGRLFQVEYAIEVRALLELQAFSLSLTALASSPAYPACL